MSKYAPLKRYLTVQRGPRLTMDFEEVAELVGGLPNSAFKYRAWWANQRTTVVQSYAWLDAGWRVERADLRSKRVTFVVDGSAR